MNDIRRSTYPHIDIVSIDAARNGVSPELAAGIERQAARVSEYVQSLGGYGARVTVECGTQRIPRTGMLVPAPTPDQWPNVRTDDGKHYRVCPPTERIIDSKEAAIAAVDAAPWDADNSALSGADIWGTHGQFAAQRAASHYTYEAAVAEVERYWQ